MLPVNTYVIWDEHTHEAAIIDAGCYTSEECETLKQFISNEKLEINYLLNTHLHFDHTFGNAFVQKEYGVTAEAHQADEFWIEEAPKQSRMFGLNLKEKPEPIGKYLHDGDIITFGNSKLEAIHVPGHSPGSLVY